MFSGWFETSPYGIMGPGGQVFALLSRRSDIDSKASDVTRTSLENG
jgi:hypothetical protein